MKPSTSKTIAIKEKADNKAGQEKTNSNNNTTNGFSTAAQRAIVYARLKERGSATTIELRDECDIMMPAARIHELRHKYGHKIDMIWTHQQTSCGKVHRIARYVLLSAQPDLFQPGGDL